MQSITKEIAHWHLSLFSRCLTDAERRLVTMNKNWSLCFLIMGENNSWQLNLLFLVTGRWFPMENTLLPKISFPCNFNWSSSSLNQSKRMKDGQWMCNDTGCEDSLFCGVTSNPLVSSSQESSMGHFKINPYPHWKGCTSLEIQRQSFFKTLETCSFLFLSNHLQDYLLNAEDIRCLQYKVFPKVSKP